MLNHALWIMAMVLVLIFFCHTGSVQKKWSLGKGISFALLVFLFLGAFKAYGAMKVWTYDHLVGDEVQIEFSGRVAGLDKKKNSTYVYLEKVAVMGLPGITRQVESPNVICILDGNGGQNLVRKDQVAGKGTLQHFETARNLGQFDERSYYESQGYSYKIYTSSLSRQNKEHDPLYRGISEIRRRLKRVYDSTLYDSGTINAMVL